MSVTDDLNTVSTDLATAQAAVEQAVTDLNATPTTEDPAWTAVKAALEANGWTAPVPLAPVVADVPADGTVADNTPSGQ